MEGFDRGLAGGEDQAMLKISYAACGRHLTPVCEELRHLPLLVDADSTISWWLTASRYGKS